MRLRSIPTARAAEIVADVANLFGISDADVLSDCRRRDLIVARREVYRQLRALGASYPTIGRLMQRDHSTIMHALKAA
ncbi:hypothetical protein GG804_25090 [Sphingomonas histidinilytica]|uniref:helix-turn-helix domain-containing protein n=1 Tax=Rhizorhabdus histidinilytica TaxID=439228 RepID=UPI001ADD104C|nr:hypothetical protein [Rhizorhabdus histidinilytica]